MNNTRIEKLIDDFDKSLGKIVLDFVENNNEFDIKFLIEISYLRLFSHGFYNAKQLLMVFKKFNDEKEIKKLFLVIENVHKKFLDDMNDLRKAKNKDKH